MTGKTDQILELLFGTRQLDEVSVSDLKDLLEEFPSFNAAHYLLSKKLKLNHSEEFSSETQKTALYFTNPFWLHWLLEAPEQAPELATEISETSQDISGSEGSIWNDPAAGTQGASSFIEESITTGKAATYEPVEEITVAESPLLQTHFSTFEKNAEQDELVENRKDDYTTAHDESPFPVTEMVSNSFLKNTNYQEEIPAQTEPENLHEYAAPDEPANDLDFHEPDDFREEPVLSIQEEETSIDAGFAEDHDQASETSMEATVDQTLTHPQPAREETLSRSPFFWEKEFQSKVHDDISQPMEAEPSRVAQIPVLKPFQDNPAFSLVETESIVTGPEEQPEENVNPVTSVEVVDVQDQQDKETRIFFEHHSTIWNPTPVGEEESGNEPLVLTTHETIAEQSFTKSDMKEEKTEQEISHSAEVEMVDLPSREIQHESTLSEINNPPDELQFTPYHTIDYFASQGIRFVQEENPTDKFGKQLKSFTAWLKTMKRLPKTLLESEMSAVTEAAIQDIAEHSIEEKEVITETMAQVLALQGQTDKAIDLYRKLSLLNPSKSAYFAARIEQIKSDLT